MANELGQRPGEQVGRPITRRNFIVWYLAGLLTATVVAIVTPILVFIYPPQAGSKKQDITVKLDKPPADLQNGEAVKFVSPKGTGFLMKDGGGDNAPGKIAFAGYAVKGLSGGLTIFAINCSHLGCSVQFNTAGTWFDCPCHGSRFSSEGQVVHGPAAYPLSHLTWTQGPNPDEIVVSGMSIPGVG